MWEKSHDGGLAAPRAPAGTEARSPRPPVTDGTAAAVRFSKFEDRCGEPPTRPPERLKNPSTFVLKKSVQTRRLEVAPPCEWPASQNALMLSLPNWPITKATMF